MNGFGLDSNIIGFHLKGNAIVRRNLDREFEAKTKVLIPPFTYYEVKRGLEDTKAVKQSRDFDELCEKCPIGEATHAVFNAAVDIYVILKANGRPCDENDIYIAAFCKTYGLTLVTNNTRHFKNIPGLSLVDWSVEQATP
jgi:predicted nucleic acid-binding protein